MDKTKIILAKELNNDYLDCQDEAYYTAILFKDLRRAIKKAEFKLTFLEIKLLNDVLSSLKQRIKETKTKEN